MLSPENTGQPSKSLGDINGRILMRDPLNAYQVYDDIKLHNNQVGWHPSVKPKSFAGYA
jgi:hypothetical protein